MATEFSKHHYAYPLRRGEFDHLSKQDRKKLRRLIARIAERSYRRGAQQGAYLAAIGDPDMVPIDKLHDWRYGISLDLSPALDGPLRRPSLDLLDQEQSDLHRIGLGEE